MKNLLTTIIMALAFTAQAHDEGHGPKLSDTGKYGGLVSAVVAKADAKLGAKAPLVHKAELVRAADGTVRIYLYDTTMKPLDLAGFDARGSATLAALVKKKYKDTDFKLELKDGSFTGKMPKPAGKPYNIDITVKQNGKELLSAFDNLD
jgi:hypothetical protein